jgi:hypothetical protein
MTKIYTEMISSILLRNHEEQGQKQANTGLYQSLSQHLEFVCKKCRWTPVWSDSSNWSSTRNQGNEMVANAESRKASRLL